MASTKANLKAIRVRIQYLEGHLSQIESLDGARNPNAIAREAVRASDNAKAIEDRLVAILNTANGQLRRRLTRESRKTAA